MNSRAAGRLDLITVARDHDSELALPIRGAGSDGQGNVVVGTGNARSGLVEHDGLGRNGSADFLRVVAIVETDAEKIAGAADTRPQPHAVFDRRQARQLEPPQRAQDLGRQKLATDIPDDSREIPNRSVLSDRARALGPRGSISHKSHSDILESAVDGSPRILTRLTDGAATFFTVSVLPGSSVTVSTLFRSFVASIR